MIRRGRGPTRKLVQHRLHLVHLCFIPDPTNTQQEDSCLSSSYFHSSSPIMPSKRKKVVLDLTRDDSDEGSVAKRPKATLPPSTTERSADLHGTFARDITANHRHEEGERQAWLAAADDDDDEDIFSLVPSTQAAAANTEQLHLYGNLSTKIVGVRYYRGHANPGQQILMRREPGNVYDKSVHRSSQHGH